MTMKPVADMTEQELNDFLAEKVMGWEVTRELRAGRLCPVYTEHTGKYTVRNHFADDWQPATDLLAAGQALGKLCEMEVIVRTERMPNSPHSVVHIGSIYAATPVGLGLAEALPPALSRAMVDFMLKIEDRMEPDE